MSSYVFKLYPAIQAFPLVGPNIPVNIDISVVLPAPFGPSNPNISPFLILRLKDLVATLEGTPPYYG
jgi:hypothetical protein